ncbi:hypothetical protein ABPG72_016570 [Tetrahymena utriculariae]
MLIIIKLQLIKGYFIFQFLPKALMQIYLVFLIVNYFYFVQVYTQPLKGSTPQSCAQNGACRDADTGCGFAGIDSNWTYKAAITSCFVTDCNQITNQNAKVSNFSCASCNTNGSASANSNSNGGNIYANTSKNACVSVNCADLQANAQMTTALCQQCVDPKASVNSDNATCNVPTYAKIQAFSILVLFVTFIF